MSIMREWLNKVGAGSFHKQLTMALVLGIPIVALLSSLAISWFVTHRLHDNFVQQGLRVAETFARQSALSLAYGSPENAEEALKATIAFPDVMAVEIIDAQGRTLVRRGDTSASRRDEAAAPPVVQGSAVEFETAAQWSFAAPVVAGASNDGDSPFVVAQSQAERLGWVRVALSKRTLNKMARDIFMTNSAISLVCAAGLLLLLRFLTGRLISPLGELSRIMQSAEKGGRKLRARVAGPREVAGMGNAFNSMMQVLEEREQELLVARDQALESARIKAEFATNVSHEIRTPMNGVLGMLEILRDTQMSREQQDYVNVARSSAQALLGLINNILDFSRGEAGKLELENAAFDLRELVEEAVYLVVGSAQQKYLELGYKIAAGVDVKVKGDAVRLRQVLVNLLGNAVKFTEIGEVALRISPDAQHAGSLLFEVKDTGIGIAEENHDRIFRSFSQVDSSTTRKFGGSGLGLTICKQIVELMNGEIGVRSRLGQGSTFWFRLSVERQGAAQQDAQASEFAKLRARILVLGMSGITTEFLKESLAAWQLGVTHVAGEDFALQSLSEAAAEKQPFGMMIIDDLAMTTGLSDFVKRLQGNDQIRDTRIAVVSRFVEPGRSAALYGPTIVGRLRKPLRLADVRDCLRQALLPELVTPSKPSYGERAETQSKMALVVEDNRTNQIVAQGFLARLGFSVSVAKNGQEAVEMAHRARYDVIFMDCNMPVMDGYEATVKIRAMAVEAERRTPIFAMTANSRASDLQKCRAAGMDDVLVKPLGLERMKTLLDAWMSRVTTVPQAVAAAVEQAQPAPIDAKVAEQLRDALGSGVDAMIEAFLGDTPEYLTQLRDAAAAQNWDALRQVAHLIKGSSANIGATSLSAVAANLEDALDNPAADAMTPLVEQVASEYQRVAQALAREGQQTPPKSVVTRAKDGLIIVADDDRSTRTALRHALEAEGFNVEEAINGQQALTLLNKISPDLVLLDAVMPVVDGFAAAREMRLRATTLPVLMITALGDGESVDRAFACGATDYIAKPVHFGVLVQRVRRLVEASRAERHVRHLAYHDSLTGLPNRLRFLEHLNRQVAAANRQGKSVAVLFLDLDRFKVINDSLGHDIGDGLLKAVAQRIVHSVHANDLVARLGGDEFVVVLEDLGNSKLAGAVAEKIATGLAAPFFIGGHEIFVEGSIGIALCPLHASDAGMLLRHADAAMYRAKRNASGYAYYEDTMGQSFSRRMWLETGLRKAVERGELFLCYQPKQDLRTRKICGVEALLRWRHPTEGLILPGEFIPIAEDNGMIEPVGEWVLRNACEQLQRWRQQGIADFGVAVNISARQLLRGDFAGTVARMLEETAIAPGLLELELTETAVMERAQDALEVLTRLRDLGVVLTIDDFGTGYSSFNYLKRLPIHVLKVDRIFIKDVLHDQNDAAIVAGMIALAHSLRLKVVAEGVETLEQKSFLEDEQCDIMQGFLLSEPLIASEFEKRVLAPPGHRDAHLKLVS